MISIRILASPQGNKKAFDASYEVDMNKGRDRDLMEETENSIHVDDPLDLPTERITKGDTSVKIIDTKFPNAIMEYYFRIIRLLVYNH